MQKTAGLAAILVAGLLDMFSQRSRVEAAFPSDPLAFVGGVGIARTSTVDVRARPAIYLRKQPERSASCPLFGNRMCLPDESRNPSDSRTLRRGDAELGNDWCAPLDEVEEEDVESPYLDDAVLSADYRTLHRDLYSWHDIYDWFRSYHNTLCMGEAALKLRRELLEALRIGDLQEAARLRDAIISMNARDEVALLQEKLNMAVNMEEYELAAMLRDDLFHAKLAREAASFPKYEVGLIVEHVRHHYRGVVLALDKDCKASEEWMTSMEVDKLPRGRRQPFYSVLVDVNDRGPEPQITYVAQENLMPSEHGDLVDHPLVERLFDGRIEERAAPLVYDSEQEAFDYRYRPGPELETMLEFMAQSQQHE